MPDPDTAKDYEHASDARAREPAEFVEAANDLRIAAEENGGVSLIEIRQSGIGPTAGFEKKGGWV